MERHGLAHSQAYLKLFTIAELRARPGELQQAEQHAKKRRAALLKWVAFATASQGKSGKVLEASGVLARVKRKMVKNPCHSWKEEGVRLEV